MSAPKNPLGLLDIPYTVPYILDAATELTKYEKNRWSLKAGAVNMRRLPALLLRHAEGE